MNLLSKLILVLTVCCVASCNTTPDKRALQYLNTDGFGNRYTGNAEEENYITIGGTLAPGTFWATDPDCLIVDVQIGNGVDIDEVGYLGRHDVGAYLVACAVGYLPVRGKRAWQSRIIQALAGGKIRSGIVTQRIREDPSLGRAAF